MWGGSPTYSVQDDHYGPILERGGRRRSDVALHPLHPVERELCARCGRGGSYNDVTVNTVTGEGVVMM